MEQISVPNGGAESATPRPQTSFRLRPKCATITW